MKKVFLESALIAMVRILSGREDSWKVPSQCTNSNQCEIGGENGGKFLIEKRDPASSVDTMPASSEVSDASQCSVALDGTNAGVPVTGLATIKLVDSPNGIVHAAKVLAWKKVGNRLVLANPDSVNDWSYRSAAGADGIAYELRPFQVAGESVSNVLSITVKHEGSTRASSSTTWSGGRGCRIGTCAVQ